MNGDWEYPRGQSIDWFLQAFLRFANDSDFRMSVTVSSGGLLISGELVSGSEYFRGFAADFVSGFPEGSADDAASWTEYFNELSESVYGSEENGRGSGGDEGDEIADDAPDDPQYLHLRDARFFHPGGAVGIPSNKGVWWRTRLEAIDGFCMGALANAPTRARGAE